MRLTPDGEALLAEALLHVVLVAVILDLSANREVLGQPEKKRHQVRIHDSKPRKKNNKRNSMKNKLLRR